MKHINDMKNDNQFLEVVNNVTKAVCIKRIMLSGGEPLLNHDLDLIIETLATIYPTVSLTTNGIKLLSKNAWSNLAAKGLSKVIMSIHCLTPEDFLYLEEIKKTLSWAKKSLSNQKNNITNIAMIDLPLRINIVVYDDFRKTLNTIEELLLIQNRINFEIRLLNNLSDIAVSQATIKKLINYLQVKEVDAYQRSGSSNVTKLYQTNSGQKLSIKIAYPYYLKSVCAGCNLLKNCHEGFYGIRLEKRKSEYFVRLCIYKQTSDVLMPYNKFLASDLPKEIRKMIKAEI